MSGSKSLLGGQGVAGEERGGIGGRLLRAAHEGRVVNFGIRDTRDTTLAVPPPH